MRVWRNEAVACEEIQVRTEHRVLHGKVNDVKSSVSIAIDADS